MPEDGGDVDGGALGRAQPQPQRLHIDVDQRARRRPAGGRRARRSARKKTNCSDWWRRRRRRASTDSRPALAHQEENAEDRGGGPPAVELAAVAGLQRAARQVEQPRSMPAGRPYSTQRMGGLGMAAQSSDRPRRTTKALVKAANTMVLAASRTNSPVNDARRWRRGRRAAAAAPAAFDGRRRAVDDIVCERSQTYPFDALVPGMDGGGSVCMMKSARRAGHTVLVRTVVDHRVHAAEIVERRRRGNGPFQRGGVPRIHRGPWRPSSCSRTG